MLAGYLILFNGRGALTWSLAVLATFAYRATAPRRERSRVPAIAQELAVPSLIIASALLLAQYAGTTAWIRLPVVDNRTIAIVAAYAAALLIVIRGGGDFVAAVLKANALKLDENPADQQGFTPQHGRWIGYFERTLTVTFVALGQYEAIGFLAAAKSIVRFPDLHAEHRSEYYLIGTLASLSYAMLIGLMFKVVIGALP